MPLFLSLSLMGQEGRGVDSADIVVTPQNTVYTDVHYFNVSPYFFFAFIGILT